MKPEDETITVTIPDRADHGGFPEHLKKYTISNKCPKCGAKRAIKRWEDYSYDGSRKLLCDRWGNECSHYDTYESIRQEAKKDDFDKLTRMVDEARFNLSTKLGREPSLQEITDHLEAEGLIPPINEGVYI
ncbi:hypothetical protein ND856_18535 [Leptospira bandrabouensis]|uniref:hypothetical protein n=1 Tax=Leptospira bandrabouensis TaxID=2484903 RepID=UPI00223D7208|nr:hypothetical protein [Leptospira bandrabouensis]MCW7460179.1 hypothetical protein [Leptospira bandrabouensis]MCW7479304.1 hypothetical protein [Leptospira bandrabouensis]MCW7486985.1 hypothetical protein [Leptospira bandrabouensis]